MPAYEFTLIVFFVSTAAGLIGALTGLGGGVIVTPALTLLLGVDIRYAIGASLVSVIATSSGAAAAYVRDGLSNIRIGMFLELATTVGAICGAMLSTKIPTAALAVIFGLVLLHSAWQTSQARHDGNHETTPTPLAERLKLNGILQTENGNLAYSVSRPGAGFGLMYIAGLLSGLLGIGSGALKVIAMDRIMRIPFKVSTATSSFMIGVTGVASAAIYLKRGYIHPVIALPVMFGVLSGAMVGARLLPRLPVPVLRRIFAVIVAVIAVQMIIEGIRGKV
ncbi:sulfite exporter TauE/SafE family protein [Edaphobacter albus]|uniref:sulfite exporter TauE/SafE family protein n=1 Tax=Edaphobacter sp. 4G125 TaxID=2763071 RepID=UPI0016494388|nr:sulfite exporter TauE/SafE family protein [Edaphobacter sp. 4G125]QNI38290.1 sulfite exporter TauE/SafE family protein [Edaphobacter sp. 4G125]